MVIQKKEKWRWNVSGLLTSSQIKVDYSQGPIQFVGERVSKYQCKAYSMEELLYNQTWCDITTS